MRVGFRRWFKDWLVNLDVFAGGFAPRSIPGQTISARAATARIDGHRWGCILCRLLEWIDPKHCAVHGGAIDGDIRRARAVIADCEAAKLRARRTSTSGRRSL